MEIYEGVKFQCHCDRKTYRYDERLEQLHYWSYLLSELGLTPLHSEGASGNLSFRVGGEAFIITKSSMIPGKELSVADYAKVLEFEEGGGTLVYQGENKPSSESVLHGLVYRNYPDVMSIMHGHSGLLMAYASSIGVPSTAKFYDYGTTELAKSVLQVLTEKNRFVLLKEHGFVAAGESIREAGTLVLDMYVRLINVIKGEI